MAQPTDQEILESLALFSKWAEMIKDDAFLKNLKLEIRAEQKGDGTMVHTGFDGPDRKTTESFLMRFRPFILQEETINFLSICNKLSLYLKDRDQELLKKVSDAREAWKKILSPDKGMKFNVNNTTIEAPEIFDLWLNGEFFHPTDKNPEKRQKLELAKIPPFEQMLFMEFIDYIQKHTLLVLWLDKNVIREIIGE